MVDDDDWDGFFSGFEFEAELLLDGGEEGWSRGVVGDGCVIGRPLELEIVAVGEVGFIDDDATGELGEFIGDDGHGKPLAIEIGAADADGFAVGLRRKELRSALSK